MTKAARLRESLRSNRIIRVAGAHNGLSAKLVEEAQFGAIWASGLEISASYGLPDTGIVTMTEFPRGRSTDGFRDEYSHHR